MSISKIVNSIKSNGNSLPPVHHWNPDLCEGQEFYIDREGEWFYNNSPVKNYRLTKLFSTVLRKDDDSYYLVTPHEKVPLKTAIAPYVITDFNFNNEDLELVTNFLSLSNLFFNYFCIMVYVGFLFTYFIKNNKYT